MLSGQCTNPKVISSEFQTYIQQGRNHASKVGGPNRAKPESRAQSAQNLRAKLESRSEPKEVGRGLGRGLGEPFPENFWNFELQIVQSGV